MDITLLELHIDDGLDFSPSGSIGGALSGDDESSEDDSGSGSSRMVALGVLALLALLAFGAKKLMAGDLEELEDIDEIPA